MDQKYNYRAHLYSSYNTNQSGRGYTNNQKRKFDTEKNQFLKEILPLIPTDKSIAILDIGCGTGSLLAALKEKNYNDLTGIDISEQQVAVAHEMGMHEVQCVDTNQFLINTDKKFDLICGMDIIEHFSKDELVELLLLLKSKMKHSGIMIFRTPNADAIFASIYAHGDFTHENLMNANSAVQLFLSLGFKEVRSIDSHIEVAGVFKNIIRMVLWKLILIQIKILLFATGRSSKQVIFTPNMIIRAGL